MERAPLRPVPGPPTGPVPDAAAVTLVAAALPALDERDRTALALVGVAGTARPQVALRLGIDEAQLADSLARARKELRRTLAPLAGSGWCERAERLISDRLDGALGERDERRLDVHLRNCPRCVEHERRLVQATDALVAGVVPAPSPPALIPAAPPELAAIEPATTEPAARDTLPARQRRRELAGVLSWNVLILVAIVLALVSLALVLTGALGAQF
jgi:putative zinc finger protein